jgi:hypothetical protein
MGYRCPGEAGAPNNIQSAAANIPVSGSLGRRDTVAPADLPSRRKRVTPCTAKLIQRAAILFPLNTWFAVQDTKFRFIANFLSAPVASPPGFCAVLVKAANFRWFGPGRLRD